MDTVKFITIIAVVVCCVRTTHEAVLISKMDGEGTTDTNQQPHSNQSHNNQSHNQSTSNNLITSANNSKTQENITSLESKRYCKTARKIDGECVRREFCNFNTPSIDLTLYAPLNFKRQCTVVEVCCPLEYITLNTPNSHPSPEDDKAFEFDEND